MLNICALHEAACKNAMRVGSLDAVLYPELLVRMVEQFAQEVYVCKYGRSEGCHDAGGGGVTTQVGVN